jgi:hypothetical protein
MVQEVENLGCSALLEMFGIDFNGYEDQTTKLNYYSNIHHILMLCKYYRTYI